MRYVTSIERLATERGMQQGVQQGMQQGIQQGVQQGESSLLLRLLTRRFGALPEWVTVQLHQAGTDLLETWFDRALEAQSLEAVFGETRH